MGGDQRPGGQRDAESVDVPRLSDDKFYRALASTQRRRLLFYLLDGEERTVEKVATVLTGWQTADSSGMRTPEDRTRVSIQLVHRDLPLLAETGLISYDDDRGHLRIEPLDPVVEDLLVASVESEPPDP